MSPKRGDRVAPPPGPTEWDVIFGTSEAAGGWDDLCKQAAGPTRTAWLAMRNDPTPRTWTDKHHPLVGPLQHGHYKGKVLPQWQYEVTGGARIWYIVDADQRRVVVLYASTRHPKATDKTHRRLRTWPHRAQAGQHRWPSAPARPAPPRFVPLPVLAGRGVRARRRTQFGRGRPKTGRVTGVRQGIGRVV